MSSEGGGKWCTVDGCGRPARRGGLCWCHTKRRQRRRPLDYDPPCGHRYRSPSQRLVEAISVLNETSSEDDLAFDRAWRRFRRALYVYVEKRRPRRRRG